VPACNSRNTKLLELRFCARLAGEVSELELALA
jgi:hypothetical protein